MTKNEFNPKWFGMTGDPIKYSEYLNLLKKGAASEKTGYLSFVISYIEKSGRIQPKQKEMMMASFKKLKDETKRNIIKNFGETIGPLGIQKLGLFGKTTETSYKVQYPEAENLGLYDYMISTDGKKWIRISAKGMTGKTNTVKPKDIVAVFPTIKSVPNNAKFAYSFIKLISEESTNEGSQKALELLKTQYPAEVKKYLPAQFHKSPVKSKVLAETVFEKLSKEQASQFSKELNALFWNALQQLSVYYIKFGIDRNGIPEFDRVSDQLWFEFEDGTVKKISDPEDNQPFVYFRGKGREAGQKRAEKPGFQL